MSYNTPHTSQHEYIEAYRPALANVETTEHGRCYTGYDDEMVVWQCSLSSGMFHRVNPFMGIGNYSAISNNMKLVP